MKRKVLAWMMCMLCMLTSGCVKNNEAESSPLPAATMKRESKKPALPEKLELNQEGVPLLQVYQVDEEQIVKMDIETYLEGVLAGEMKNDWPIEALKAQAILARTFVLKFCTEKESMYEGADISTSIEEAQAYDATGVNSRIKKAVKETRGLVLSHDGQLPYAWFHAHSGGVTALAGEGLAYEDQEPGYTQVVKGMESGKAPADARAWEAEFTVEEVVAAAEKCGLKIGHVDEIEIADTGESGRAETIAINGQNVPAAKLRIELGSTKMRSTLLTSLRAEGERVKMAGKGYGHGVGMPQWGAYAMAEDGKTAEEIVTYYFRDVTVEKVW